MTVKDSRKEYFNVRGCRVDSQNEKACSEAISCAGSALDCDRNRLAGCYGAFVVHRSALVSCFSFRFSLFCTPLLPMLARIHLARKPELSLSSSIRLSLREEIQVPQSG